jgi:Ni/Fe-hydrogenase subunit HybB-like protein
MAPLVCSVHSIVGLDFAGAATVGWHSTMFPPFFIFGAFLSGFATVLLLIMPMRRLLRLERYITGRHLDVLGRLLLTSSLFVGYAYIMDGFNAYYGGEKAEITMYHEKLFGYYAGIFWATVLFNVALPQLLWFRTIRLNQLVVALIAIGVIVGMWCERYTIVVVSLHRPHLPSSYGLFHGSIWDWLTMMGTVGFFIFGILLVVRLIPVISMFEMREILAPKRP